MTNYSKERIEDSLSFLNNVVKKGDTIYTSVSNVSRSGMSRHIKLYVANGKDIINITRAAAVVGGDRISNTTDGIVVSGCGMDMGFNCVYNLGRVLFPKGFKTTKRTGARNGSTIGTKDIDGGYAFNHRWL